MSYTTIWEVPDELWRQIAPLLPPEKPAGSRGRPALPNRQVLNGILYVLRTGCQWKSLKKEWFGASSSLHARFQAWQQAGLFEQIFRLMVLYYHRRKRIQWRWQAIDSKSVPAPLGGEQTGKNPTDRGKLGSKRHILVDARGAPLAVVVTGANEHDLTCALELLQRIVVPRPQTHYRVQHLCADKGYDSEPLRQNIRQLHYHVHFRRREFANRPQADPVTERRHPARHWVVERTLSWQNDFRSLRVRWAKKADNWVALIHLACAFVLWQMAIKT
jgi:putative transposase